MSGGISSSQGTKRVRRKGIGRRHIHGTIRVGIGVPYDNASKDFASERRSDVGAVSDDNRRACKVVSNIS